MPEHLPMSGSWYAINEMMANLKVTMLGLVLQEGGYVIMVVSQMFRISIRAYTLLPMLHLFPN